MIKTTINKVLLTYIHPSDRHLLEKDPDLIAGAIADAIKEEIERVHKNMMTAIFDGIPG